MEITIYKQVNKICNRYNLKSFAKCIQLTGHRLDRNKILPVDSLDVTTTAWKL